MIDIGEHYSLILMLGYVFEEPLLNLKAADLYAPTIEKENIGIQIPPKKSEMNSTARTHSSKRIKKSPEIIIDKNETSLKPVIQILAKYANAYSDISRLKSKEAIKSLNTLSENLFNTSWTLIQVNLL